MNTSKPNWAFCVVPNNAPSLSNPHPVISKVWNRNEEQSHETFSLAQSMATVYDGYPTEQEAKQARDAKQQEYEQHLQDYYDSLEPESGYDQ